MLHIVVSYSFHLHIVSYIHIGIQQPMTLFLRAKGEIQKEQPESCSQEGRYVYFGLLTPVFLLESVIYSRFIYSLTSYNNLRR